MLARAMPQQKGDNMEDRKLIKVDKNGTKYWEVPAYCTRCGGSGYLPAYGHVDHGICFKCGGSGNPHTRIEKEYTPEYAKKLEARRAKREEKRLEALKAEMPAKKAEWLEREGFNADGKTYVFLGNTYEIKDEIKALGGQFDRYLNWHIANPVDGYQFLEIDVEEVTIESMYDGYVYDYDKWLTADIETRRKTKWNQENIADAGYYGNVGDKINLDVTYVGYNSWENNYGYYGGVTFLYTFEMDGHTFIWKTSKFMCDEINEGDTITISGTIKEHSEYNGIKQTVLTRCKVA